MLWVHSAAQNYIRPPTVSKNLCIHPCFEYKMVAKYLHLNKIRCYYLFYLPTISKLPYGSLKGVTVCEQHLDLIYSFQCFFIVPLSEFKTFICVERDTPHFLSFQQSAVLSSQNSSGTYILVRP